MITISIAALLVASAAPPLTALARMPVREVTVFKDGHAFVLHEGKLPVNGDGDVVLDRLPIPVLGTFWPYAAETGARLDAVTAGRRRVSVAHTALAIAELIAANPGAAVHIDETPSGDPATMSYDATIVGVPERDRTEMEAATTSGGPPALPQRSEVVLLKTATGTTAVRLDQIRRVSFRGEHRAEIEREEFRDLLRMRLSWPGGGARPAETTVGMAYLQKGMRWIPSYRVEIDGQGHAQVRLQATLVNELIDLEDATVHLVIGVPTFAFKDALDPIALQQTLANLGPLFESGARTTYSLSNAIMSQTSIIGGLGSVGGSSPFPAAPAPEVGAGEKEEDLFIFTVHRVSLKKGERMVLAIAEARLEYRDLFTVDLPVQPPFELYSGMQGNQQSEIEKMLRGPTALHVLRILNSGEQPLTTAPALIISAGRVLGQGLLPYTPRGGQTDLPITTAVDLKIRKSEREAGRVANALTQNGNSYSRVDVKGKIRLRSFRDEPSEIEITRRILGHTGGTTLGGKMEMLSAFEESPFAGREPMWWNWISWPGWWQGVNGVGRFSWTVKLEAKQSLDLGFTWHYFWR